MKRILLLLMFGLGVFSAQSQITVDDTQTVQQLVDNVLVLGNCAEVNNIISPNNSEVGGETWKSFGSFDATGTTFAFSSGIVLASNDVNAVPSSLTTFGPENGTIGSWVGDPDLETIIQPDATHNATVIEFEFIPFVDEINFNYIFASMEYEGTFECTFSDTFAFILSGPGISDVNDYNHDANPNTPDLSLDLGGLNIAVAPGTNIPISSTNIHNLTTCPPDSPGEFAIPQLFDVNSETSNDNAYVSWTVPLTASASVIPGQTYNIKLVIADARDAVYSSGVFIESASFDLGGIDLGPDITIENGAAACEGDTIILDAGFSATNIQYFWAKDGNIIPGENSQTLEVTEPGQYEVGIQVGDASTACFGVSNLITVEFFPLPTFSLGDTLNLCQGDTLVLDGTPTNASVFTNITYQWFKDSVTLVGETNSTLSVDEPGEYQLIIDADNCTDISNITTVNLIDYQLSLPTPSQTCIGAGETVEIVPDFTGLTPEQINQVSYSWSTGETTPTIQLDEAGEITLTTNYEGCEESVTQAFTFFNNPEVDIAGASTLCDGNTNTLDATPLNLSELQNPTYVWTLDGTVLPNETNPTLDITEGGLYEVTVDNNSCSTTAQFEVDFVSYTLDLGNDENLCTGDGGPQNITIMPNTPGLTSAQENQITYSWSDGSTEETLTVSESGTFTLVTNVNGCIKTDEITISIVETLDVNLTDSVLKCPEDAVVLNTGLPDDNPDVTYSWTLDGVPVGDNSPSITADQEGTYVITVDNQGCPSSATAEVSNYSVDNCVISQGISPGVDGRNDCMDLTWLNDQLGIDRFRVFNRYGKKVFDEANYEDTFCGQDDNGDELSTGTYFYVIDLANSDQRFERVVKGWVYINLEQ